MLTQEQKTILRKIISGNNPIIEDNMERFASMSDEQIIALINQEKLSKVAFLQEQKLAIEAEIALLGVSDEQIG